jgi:hypothetical protein
VCAAFCRLVTNLQAHPTHLEAIAAHNLIPNTWTILSQSFSSSSTAAAAASSSSAGGVTQTLNLGADLLSQLLGMLSSLAASCPPLAVSILSQPDIGVILRGRMLHGKDDDGRRCESAYLFIGSARYCVYVCVCRKINLFQM